MTKNKYLSLVLILLITFVASAIGGFTTASFKEPWYSEIILPSFNPPSWVFGPVWTMLYILMSIAIWRIWIKFFDRKILNIYFYHLFFNAMWSIIFFGFHQIELALLNLVIILIFIIILMRIYFYKDKLSFLFMAPYFLWSSFAFVLNTAIAILN
ncbi:MAG: tryptophan-rich sensory protein [Proteobacteria bacterium]|nr:tryptophan-rich sensory protein [Pseudomonadota bacterium]